MSDFEETEGGPQAPYAQVRPEQPWLFPAIGATWVVVLLGAVLAPVFLSTSQGHGHSDYCISNLKQTNLAALMYSGDYDDRLTLVTRWTDAICPYMKSEELFNCPTIKELRPYGHAMDSRLGGRTQFQFDDVANRPYLFDSTDWGRSASDALLSPRAHPEKTTIAIAWLDGHGSRKSPAVFREIAAGLTPSQKLLMVAYASR